MRFGILSRGAPLVSWALAFGWGWGGASDAWAQYFGGNQVQYKEFDFQVMKTEHLDVYYYPEEREAVTLAAPMAERWYARLSRILDHQFESRQPVILYAGHSHFQQTNAIPVSPGEGTGGVSEVFKRRVLLPFAGSLAETDHVLGHELVHAFQFDITGKSEHDGCRERPGGGEASAVVYRGHGRVPVAGLRRPAYRHVDARRVSARHLYWGRASSAARGIFPIATARRSSPVSAVDGAIA
jgi:hypothetical protein